MKRTLTAVGRSLAVGLLAAIAAGCAGDGPPPQAATSQFDTIQQTIFNVNCLSAGCHNTTDQAGELVLVQGLSYANLVNVTPFNTTAAAAGMLRVVPNNTALSFLLTKLNGPGPGEGVQMPSSAAPLSAANITLISQWILDGAPASNLPTATATGTETATPEPTSTSTSSPSATPSATLSPTISPTGTRPATATPTNTVPVTASPTHTATAAVSATPSTTPTASPRPTPTYSIDSTFPQIQATIFNPTCLDLSCHNARDAGGALVLEAAQSYAALVGVVPDNAAARADGLLRVDAGQPDKSFLLTKLTLPRAFDPLFGSRMPLGKLPLTATQIDKITAWILRGALPNETAP